MKLAVLLPVLLLLFSPGARAEEAIPVGERLVFQMYWLGVPIGTAELWAKEKTVMGGKKVVHVVGAIQTNKFLSAIHPVRDEAHSWIDVKTLHSVRFEKKISEGGKREEETIVFEKPGHDVLSAFYWARRQPLAPGGSFRTTLYADRREWALEVRVMKRETLRLREGAVETLLIEPRSRVGGVEKKGKSLIHLSDDAAKKPLKITYKAAFGGIVGWLAEDGAPV